MTSSTAADPEAADGGTPLSSAARRDQLVAELVELRSIVNAAEARCAEITAELAAASDGHPLGCRSVTQFLSWQAGLSVTAGRALETAGAAFAELPSLRTAATAGEVSVWQARAVASAAVDDDEAAGLLEIARHGTFGQLERACRHLVRSRSGGDDADAAAHRARRLRTWWTVHRTLRLDGELDAEAAAVLADALEHACGAVPDDAVETADDRDAARRADALEVLARSFLDDGRDTSDGAPPGHVAVHVGLDLLVGDGARDVGSDAAHGPDGEHRHPFGGASARDGRTEPGAHPRNERLAGGDGTETDPPTAGPCRLGWNGPGVADALIRRLGCDATLQAVVVDAEANPLALGRRHRVVNRRLRRALFARDGGRCAAPGCDARRFLHAHHVVHWSDGGSTDLDNLVLLCHWHHRLVHDGMLTVTVDGGRPLVRRSDPDRSPRPPPVTDVAGAARRAGIRPRPDAAHSRWSGDRIDWACFDAAHLGSRPPPHRDAEPAELPRSIPAVAAGEV